MTIESGDGDAPLLRVMGLRSLAYCERLHYLEEVEGLEVANEPVYAGRALHQAWADDDPSATEIRSYQLSSEQLGLTGKIDALRVRDGQLVPYEHKRGRPWRDDDGQPAAWPSDELQVAGYALLLEEARGQPVTEGRVRYHADSITVRVPITPELRARVAAAVERARALRRQLERPPVTTEERRCARCSLSPVCLPEEERLAAGALEEASRLFPAVEERQAVHVLTPGARISRSSDRLVVRGEAAALASLPVHEVGAVVLHGPVQITTQALQLCVEQEVGVHWLSTGGRHLASLAAGAGSVQRRIRQYAALTDPGQVLRLARRLALARMESQLRYLLRATRQDEAARREVTRAIGIIRSQLTAAARAEGVAALRGHEGTAGRAYFSALPALVGADMRAQLGPQGRSRRPPRDPFNAALSFGYALLHRSVMGAILAVGLEPAFGFFHTPRSAAHPLVLDLMELFRVPVWDVALVASINRQQWGREEHFVIARDHVWLSEAGRKLAIQLYERRLQDVWRHPVLEYSLSYARAMELEVRLLEKEWTGSPGLFGRARLR